LNYGDIICRILLKSEKSRNGVEERFLNFFFFEKFYQVLPNFVWVGVSKGDCYLQLESFARYQIEIPNMRGIIIYPEVFQVVIRI